MPRVFLLMTQVLTVPVLVVSPVLERVGLHLPAGLPVTAVMTFVPALVALALSAARRGPAAAWLLLRRAWDVRGLNARWLLPMLGVMPVIMLLSDLINRGRGQQIPGWEVDGSELGWMLAVFVVGAAGEELGWQGYAVEPLQARWGALKASLLVGAVWGLWHVAPFAMMGRSWDWVLGQCLFSVAARVLMVWMGNNTEQNVLGAMLFHATINTTYAVFPGRGAFYSPAVTALVTTAFALVVLARVDARTFQAVRR